MIVATVDSLFVRYEMKLDGIALSKLFLKLQPDTQIFLISKTKFVRQDAMEAGVTGFLDYPQPKRS